MRINRLIMLCCAAFLGSSALLTAAQTGRIAHLSHGGSAATLAAAAAAGDNFGLWEEYKYAKITRLNDSLVLVEGQRRWPGGAWQPLKVQQYHDCARHSASPKEIMTKLRKQFPEAVFVGFEAANSRKAKRKRRKAALTGATAPQSPAPGRWLALAVVAGLGTMGWLLPGKAQPTPEKIT